jgi:hypothetical protein
MLTAPWQCFNFEAGGLTIHAGKGGNDRALPPPATCRPELRAQLEAVTDLHPRALERPFAGVFLVHTLDSTDQHAAQACIWPWWFPAPQLTAGPKTAACRRSQLQPTPLQQAMPHAPGSARIDQRAAAPTVRHSVASHVRQAHDESRTMQA